MLYFSVLQFSFDSFFITFFFAETFFMCFRIICNWLLKSFYASSVQFSHSLVSDSLWPPWTAAWQDSLSITKSWSLLKLLSIKSCPPSSWWCHPTISSSIVLFSSCLQSFPASGSFPVSQLFASGGHSIGVSASTSVHPMNIQDWFPLGLTGLISLQSKSLSSLIQHQYSKASILWCSTFLYGPTHSYMTTGKTIVWLYRPLLVMSLLFNMLSKFVIAFLPRSKHHYLQWFWSPRK